MNKYQKAEDQIIFHEGFRRFPYHCTSGRLTIGYGRNLQDVGISVQEAYLLLQNDIRLAEKDLKTVFVEWNSFSEQRKIALIDMRFNLGLVGFRGFKKMIAAIKNNDWQTASREATNSKWFNQVKGRAVYIVGQLLNG